jgi:hypothetical protein
LWRGEAGGLQRIRTANLHRVRFGAIHSRGEPAQTAVVQSIIADLRASSRKRGPYMRHATSTLRSVRNSWTAAPMSMVRYGRFCRGSIASRRAGTGWPSSARGGSDSSGQRRGGFGDSMTVQAMYLDLQQMSPRQLSVRISSCDATSGPWHRAC